jgi:hypothetical protein
MIVASFGLHEAISGRDHDARRAGGVSVALAGGELTETASPHPPPILQPVPHPYMPSPHPQVDTSPRSPTRVSGHAR